MSVVVTVLHVGTAILARTLLVVMCAHAALDSELLQTRKLVLTLMSVARIRMHVGTDSVSIHRVPSSVSVPRDIDLKRMRWYASVSNQIVLISLFSET